MPSGMFNFVKNWKSVCYHSFKGRDRATDTKRPTVSHKHECALKYSTCLILLGSVKVLSVGFKGSCVHFSQLRFTEKKNNERS